MSYQQVADGQVHPEVPINENMAALGQAFVFSHNVTADSGLVVGINGGGLDGSSPADTTVTCTDNTTNYVVAHRTTLAVTTATATTNWNNIATYGRIGRAVFASGVLTFHDERYSHGGIFDRAAALATGDVVGPGSATDSDFAQFDGTTGKLIKDGGLSLDTDTSLAANSDARIPSQKAIKAFVASQITGGASDVMIFKGVIDCSANPNYPAADAGNVYKVSVAGKIGGASGPNVEVGDTLYCIADGTASGNQATVGASWAIVQVNIDGAVTGPASATSSNVATFNGTSGKTIQDSGVAFSTDGAFTANSDALSPTQKAVKTYIAGLGYGTGSGSVTSVAATVPSWLSVSGSPITTSGTLAISAASGQTANRFLATPDGSTGAVGLRAIVAADVPTLNQNTTGSAAKLTTARSIGGTSFDGSADITQPFDVPGFYPGIPTASAKVLRVPLARAVTFAGNFAGSYFTATANATGSTVFDVQKNGSSIGSITIASGTTTATFTTTSGTSKSFAAGDVLAIISPGTPDATLADPGFVLAGTR